MSKTYYAPKNLQYDKEWELDALYADWIAPVKNSKQGARCKYCGVIFVAHTSALDAHAVSELHMSNIPNSTHNFNTAKYKKNFQRYWLRNPAFSGWLEPVKNRTNKALCNLCNTYISARHSALLKHAKTLKHISCAKKGKKKKSFASNNIKIEETSFENDEEDSLRNDDSNNFPPLYFENEELVNTIDKLETYNDEDNDNNDDDDTGKELFYLEPDREGNYVLDLECEEVEEKYIDLYLDKDESVAGETPTSDIATRFSQDVGYQQEWENDPLFKDWLSRVKDDTKRAQCVVCLHRMAASHKQLLAHSRSHRHKMNMQDTCFNNDVVDAASEEDVDEDCVVVDDKFNAKSLKNLANVQKMGYQEEWEENPLFKDWLRRSRGSNNKASCRYCTTSMIATTQKLISHLESARHKRNCVVLWKKKDPLESNAYQMMNKSMLTVSEIQKQWEKDPLFKDWIKFIAEDNTKVECGFCMSKMFATRHQLLNHIGSRRHQRNAAENVQRILIHEESDVDDAENMEECITKVVGQLGEDDIYNDPSNPYVNNNIRTKILYRHEWQDDKYLKDWISGVPETEKRAFCKVCNTQLRASYPVLRLHTRTPKHIAQMQRVGLTTTLTNQLQPKYENVEMEDATLTEEEPSLNRNKFVRLGYQFNWEKDANYKDWIVRIKSNDHKVGCRYCRSQMRATPMQLSTHMHTDRHINNKQIFTAQLQDEEEEEEEEDREDLDYQSGILNKPKIYKKYKRRYQKSWERDPVLTSWVEIVPGDAYKASCKFCKVIINARYTALRAHADTTKHINCMKNKPANIRASKSTKQYEFREDNKYLHLPCVNAQQKIWAKYCRTYRNSWEVLPEFKDWIERVPGDVTRARCKFCHVLLRARLVELKNHSATWKHAASVANANNRRPAVDGGEEHEQNISVVAAASRSNLANKLGIKRRLTSGSLSSSRLATNQTLDLHRCDDSLVPISVLEKMITIMPDQSANTKTVVLPPDGSLNAATIDSMVSANPSTIFTVRSGVDPIKKRKRKHDEMTLMINEVLSTLTRSITPWEFLLCKISRTPKKSASYKIKTLMAEFEVMCQQMKSFASQILLPANMQEESTEDEVIVKLSDSLSLKCMGLAKGNYNVLPSSDKMFVPNITIPIRFTQHMMQTISSKLAESDGLNEAELRNDSLQQPVDMEAAVTGNYMMLDDGRLCHIVDINNIHASSNYDI